MDNLWWSLGCILAIGIACVATIGFCWVIVVVVTDAKKKMKIKIKEEYMEERIKAIIAEQLGVNLIEVSPQALFIEDLGMDSLDAVELVMELEEEFNIEIPDEDAEKLLTPGDVVKYIEEKVKAK